MSATDTKHGHEMKSQLLPGATRTLLSMATGCLGALIAFGLLTSLAWSLISRDGRGSKIALLLFVAALSFLAGGWISGKTAGSKRRWHGLAVGLLVGLFSFGYILGPQVSCLALALGAGLFGYLGGQLAEGGHG